MLNTKTSTGGKAGAPRKFLVADLFCGAGGSSTGARRAIRSLGGQMDLIAVNHWPTAIATHSRNHPTARHLVEDVSIVAPETIVAEGRLDLLMASPECTWHSIARGGKPIHDQQRMNPWAIHNWLTRLDVANVLVENVPEFVNWGPLNGNERPIRDRQGEYFAAWFFNFQALGYNAEWRILNAADYGEATSRRRFFLIARKDNAPISWPEPTHTKQPMPLFPHRKPWRGAREIIDWEQPGRSLLDDPKYRRKPLAKKTLRRIAKGLEKFGGPLAYLYIRLLDLPAGEQPIPDEPGNGCQPNTTPIPCIKAKDIDQPIPASASTLSLAEPSIVEYYGQSSAGPTNQPLTTITAQGRKHALVEPVLIQYYGNSREGASADAPLPTITTRDRHGLVKPTLLRVNHDNRNDRKAHYVERPLAPAATSAGTAIAEPEPEQPTKPGIDPRRLVLLDGQLHLLDIRFRMLNNRELARAMGFDDETQHYEFAGKIAEVTRQIGNAVPVNMAAALVGAILSDPPGEGRKTNGRKTKRTREEK